MIQMLDFKIFDGPSIYSHKPVAKILLKMEEYIDTPSTEIEGLYDYLVSHFPGLSSHYCSKGYEGGFLERLSEGTYLAHIIEHLCLEIQNCLGYQVRYGKTRRAKEDCYDIVFAYENKQVVKACTYFIIDYVKSFLNKQYFDFENGMAFINEAKNQEVQTLYDLISIPIIAVTGTSGKTTTIKIISDILSNSGYKVGIATTQGIYKNNICIKEGNATGYASAKKVINDSTIQIAILETSGNSILQEGLAYTKADVAVFTNLAANDLGIKDIDAMTDLLHIKSLVVEAVKNDGVSVLNGDDPYASDFMERAKGRIILYSLNRNTPIINNHMNRGGEIIWCENGSIYAIKEGIKRIIIDVADIPATLNDSPICNSYNAMAAISACYALGISLDTIADYFFQNEGTISTSRV